MAEYVHHEVNGLLFAHRDPAALAAQMQRLADDPALARRLGARGYVDSRDRRHPRHRATTSPPSRRIYAEVLARRDAARVARAGPVARHLRHQPRHLQPALHHVRGALAPQPAAGSGARRPASRAA